MITWRCRHVNCADSVPGALRVTRTHLTSNYATTAPLGVTVRRKVRHWHPGAPGAPALAPVLRTGLSALALGLAGDSMPNR